MTSPLNDPYAVEKPKRINLLPYGTMILLLAHFAYFLVLLIINRGFSSFDENPFLGPSMETLYECGARNNMAIKMGEYWRFVTPIFISPGVTALLFNWAYILGIGWNIEPKIGAVRLFFTYFLAGIGGNLVSACFFPGEISMGSLSSLFGLAALFIADIRINNHSYKRHYLITTLLIVGLIISVFFGLTPLFDNFGILTGFILGVIISFGWMKKYNDKEEKLMNYPNHTTLRVIICSVLLIVPFVVGFYVFFEFVPDYDWCSVCVNMNCIEVVNWNLDWCPMVPMVQIIPPNTF